MAPSYHLLFTLCILILQSHGVHNQKARDWLKEGQDELSEALRVRPILQEAKNVILFIGDGMGVSTVTSSRIYNAQKSQSNFWEGRLSFDEFPHVGLCMTYCTDKMVTDSAASATAFLTGIKTSTGLLGIKDNVKRGECDQREENKLTSVLEYAHQAGKRTGIVTTARITHATPAGAYAHVSERDWESNAALPEGSACKDIARQLIEDNNYINVLLGGGRGHMTPNTTSDPEYPGQLGLRTDGLNLTEEWKRIMMQTFAADDEKYKFVQRLEEFNDVDPEKVERLLGLFEPGHMHYEVDRLNTSKNIWLEPSLAEMTEKAIRMLRKEDNGYFLIVESGRIDHAHHDNNAYRALNDTVAMSDAVKKAVDMTSDQDTLILVTADHSHVFTMAGYPYLNDNILGLSSASTGDRVEGPPKSDGLPFSVLSYANGPGFIYHYNTTDPLRRNLTGDDLGAVDYVQPSSVPLGSETHAGEDVALYGRGPLSHLVTGTHEDSYIAHLIMYASCIGPDETRNFCKEKPDYKDWPRDPKFVDPAAVKSGAKLCDCMTAMVWLASWLVVALFG